MNRTRLLVLTGLAACVMFGPACGPKTVPEPKASSFERMVVKSGSIEAVAYSEEAHVLRVEMNDGSTVDYLGVPQSKYVELTSAYSAETYIDSQIKGKYKIR